MRQRECYWRASAFLSSFSANRITQEHGECATLIPAPVSLQLEVHLTLEYSQPAIRISDITLSKDWWELLSQRSLLCYPASKSGCATRDSVGISTLQGGHILGAWWFRFQLSGLSDTAGKAVLVEARGDSGRNNHQLVFHNTNQLPLPVPNPAACAFIAEDRLLLGSRFGDPHLIAFHFNGSNSQLEVKVVETSLNVHIIEWSSDCQPISNYDWYTWNFSLWQWKQYLWICMKRKMPRYFLVLRLEILDPYPLLHT